jgi:hypothetical protein
MGNDTSVPSRIVQDLGLHVANRANQALKDALPLCSSPEEAYGVASHSVTLFIGNVAGLAMMLRHGQGRDPTAIGIEMCEEVIRALRARGAQIDDELQQLLASLRGHDVP